MCVYLLLIHLISGRREWLVILHPVRQTQVQTYEPFGVAYIHDDLLELERDKKKKGDKEGWKPKMKRYVKAFRDSPQVLSQHFNVRGRVSPRVYGLIVVRWPFPIPAELGDELSAIDWPTLFENLNHGEKTVRLANCTNGFVNVQTSLSF